MLTFTEHKILKDWKDYFVRSHKQFKQTTRSKCYLSDYLFAINSECQWLKRQYPTVKNKLIVGRAYKNLLEAYQRAAEYPVKLSWKSLASFAINRRPSILWAVLQAKADGPTTIQEPKKTNIHHTQIILERTWCKRCQTLSLVIDNKLECCNEPIGEKANENT